MQPLSPIGVLGGMGPQATIHFMDRVLRAVDAGDDSDHIPLIVSQNPQVPSRIAALVEGGGVDPTPALIQDAKRLQAAGAEALVMPCATAHHFAPAIAAAVQIPFLNMIDLAAAEARRQVGPCDTIGLLGSPAIERAGVFDHALGRHGLRPVYSQHSNKLLSTIRRIKSSGPDAGTAQSLREIITELHHAGAGAICICCSEFSLHAADLSADLPLFDALECLVTATVSASRGMTMPYRLRAVGQT